MGQLKDSRMLFGDLIAQLSNECAAEEALLRLCDLPLLAELRTQAEANGLDLGAYTAAAVNRYASGAPDEEWITLIGAMSRAQDPGKLYLERALVYAGKCHERESGPAAGLDVRPAGLDTDQ